ncbi:MAG: GIY-YIG nuclease family protein [Candidatus Moranbacteria bacterium]|nr:GIY-YIG nuclease family protein [Candidatus Moranbacteria bacterium]
MYTVYVLQDKEGKFYKGVTNNIKRRLYEHKQGKTKTTRKMDELKIVYTEKYKNFKEVRRREVYFKTAAGRRFLKKILNKRATSSAG